MRTSTGFSDAERAAIKERSSELKTEQRRGKRSSKKDGEGDLLAKITEMPDHDRSMAERLHEIVKETVPELGTPR